MRFNSLKSIGTKAFCREIFHGTPAHQLPDIVRTYTVGPEGRVRYYLKLTHAAMTFELFQFIYISGWNLFVRHSDFALTHTPTLWIYDCLQLKRPYKVIQIYEFQSLTLPLDCDQYVEVVDFYSLNETEFVLMTFDQHLGVLSQNLLKIDRFKNDTICELQRNWKFNAIQRSVRVGIGGASLGYVVICGMTSAEMGAILMVRMIAADPRSTKHPQINLDEQIYKLETIVKQHPNELFIWPLSTVMLNNKGVYLPLAKRCGNSLIAECSLIGAIEFKADERFDIKLIRVDDSNIRDVGERELCINYVSMMAQKGRSAWFTSIVPAHPSHWRWKLQKLATCFCRFMLLYLGTFLLWLSRYDGGLLAYWFGRFYLWLLSGRISPNLGPKPTFHMYSLDMNNWRFVKKRFEANGDWLRGGGQAMIDTNERGGIILSEVTRDCDRIRMTAFPRPFIPEKLSTQAFQRCYRLYPKLRSQPRLYKEWGIIDYNLC
ncbi:unnamed protein product [Anisakis simplex]|uniref:Protein kinase domain-containing protein n=1 Tax=Anisakis simplex TaxID=6269 RepID=A0A0M3JVM7_ANISI|nr:unnamed protein product [Anisakis simplex]